MRRRAFGVGLVAMLLVAAAFWWRWPEQPSASARGSSAPLPSVRTHARGSSSAAPEPGPGERRAPERGGGGATDRAARWRSLLGAVHAAQAKRVAAARAASPNAPGPDAEAVGTIDRATIREGIQEMKGLLAECYEQARRQNPSLEGRLVVEFSLIGEPGVGAIVEESRIDPASELAADPSLSECVRETLMTLELDAPPQGGRVEVRYPFVFRAADPDAGPPD